MPFGASGTWKNSSDQPRKAEWFRGGLRISGQAIRFVPIPSALWHASGLLLDLATDEDLPGHTSVWANHIAEPEHYSVRLRKDPGEDELSTAEVQLLDEVFQLHGTKSRWELVDFTHKLPEWKNPQGSAIPIQYRDILKAGGKTEIEIAAIEDELEGIALMENMLGAR